jgi:hypothetical protein
VATRLSKYTFIIIGAILGALIGIYVKSIVPRSTMTIDSTTGAITTTSFWSFLFNIETLSGLILGFFIIELVLAMILNKPRRVLGITFGFLVIPWIWGAIADYPYAVNIWGKLGLYLFFSFANFAAIGLPWGITALVSLVLIPYLVGIDTSAMADGTLLKQAFSINLEVRESLNSDFVDIIADRMGFTRTRTEDSDTKKLSYYLKDSLRMSVLQTVEKNTARLVFDYYAVSDDTVKNYENPEEIPDYTSQVKALIAQRTPEQVLNSSESTPALEDLKQMAEGLCLRKLPARDQIKRVSREFPKNHPNWFSLIVLILGTIVVEIMRTLLFH